MRLISILSLHKVKLLSILWSSLIICYENVLNLGLYFTDFMPARLNVGIMVFFACFFTYMLRANMSINLLAMVQPTASLDLNTTAADPPDVNYKQNAQLKHLSKILLNISSF